MSKTIKEKNDTVLKEVVKYNLLKDEHRVEQGNQMFFILLSDTVTLIISTSIFYLVFMLAVKNITALML